MLDLASVAQIVAIALLALVVVVFMRYLIEGASNKRLMRCPETGAVAFVGAEQVSRRDGETPTVVVRSCEFWPARKDCAQGCLARYGETMSGYRVKLDALRPFERP
jgi:hypothetical protein